MNIITTANNFMAAYNESTWVFGRIADELVFLMNNSKSFSVEACNWLEMDVDTREIWIIENVLTKLQIASWPKFGCKEFHTIVQNAQHKFVFGV